MSNLNTQYAMIYRSVRGGGDDVGTLLFRTYRELPHARMAMSTPRDLNLDTALLLCERLPDGTTRFATEDAVPPGFADEARVWLERQGAVIWEGLGLRRRGSGGPGTGTGGTPRRPDGRQPICARPVRIPHPHP